jgi:uncharacterized protein (TIGR02246 family)
MLRSRFVVLLLTLFLAGSPLHAATGAADALAIRHVMEQQQAAWNRGDVAAYMQGYKDAPNTTFVGSTVSKGYRQILASYRKHYAMREQMGQLSFSALDVRLLPDASGQVRYAAVTGHFHLLRTVHGEAGKDDGVFSLLWEKTAKGWKIILDHTS